MIYIIILVISIIANFFQLGGEPAQIITENAYTCMVMNDSSRVEVYEYTPDSMLVVVTACAPQCSSCARIYNKEGELLSAPQSPTPSIFPDRKSVV